MKNLQANWPKVKKKRTPISKIKNDGVDTTTDATDIKAIINNKNNR